MAGRDETAKYWRPRTALGQVLDNDYVQRGMNGKPQVRNLRRDGWTVAKRHKFLEVLRVTSNVAEAARAVKRSVSGAYALRRRDPAFAAAWLDSLAQGYDELEMLYLRQGLHGYVRIEVVQEGLEADAPVRSVKRVFDFPHNIAIRLLTAHRKEVAGYRAAQMVRPADDAEAQAQLHEVIAGIRQRIHALPPPENEPEPEGDGA